MKEPTIHDWGDLCDDGWNTLLLGNGASIAVDRRFGYGALLALARDEGLITQNIQSVFDYLRTEDFELVLNMLWHTNHVNRALRIEDAVSRRAYSEIKRALIETVRRHHPSYEDISRHLKPAYEFMAQFQTVVSLNYDLIGYWALLAGNEALGKRRFKDCFTVSNPGPGLAFDRDWQRLYEPLGSSETTLVFYPHGNLVLVSGLTGIDQKLRLNEREGTLLETILRTWEADDVVPLFVSEGIAEQKLAAINRSDYLGRVYNQILNGLGPSVVIYGWSMSDHDVHILRKVCLPSVKRLAISVRRNDDRGTGAKKCRLFRGKIRDMNSNIKIQFFDAESEGCWIHA